MDISNDDIRTVLCVVAHLKTDTSGAAASALIVALLPMLSDPALIAIASALLATDPRSRL